MFVLPNGPLGTYADFTFTFELPFASFSEQVLVVNVSHEKDLIFMQMNIYTDDIIFMPIVSHKDSFCHRGKSKLGIWLFIHELLREPLIFKSFPINFTEFFKKENSFLLLLASFARHKYHNNAWGN